MLCNILHQHCSHNTILIVPSQPQTHCNTALMQEISAGTSTSRSLWSPHWWPHLVYQAFGIWAGLSSAKHIPTCLCTQASFRVQECFGKVWGASVLQNCVAPWKSCRSSFASGKDCSLCSQSSSRAVLPWWTRSRWSLKTGGMVETFVLKCVWLCIFDSPTLLSFSGSCWVCAQDWWVARSLLAWLQRHLFTPVVN